MRLKRKVCAYITQGQRLLVFEHPFAPEAGLQVPAGTIEAGETPRAAVLRESHEETGLVGLRVVRMLGIATVDMRPWGKSEHHRRYIYHLTCSAYARERWRHGEQTPSGTTHHKLGFAHIFAFYWANLDDVPPLATQQDVFLAQLRAEVNNIS